MCSATSASSGLLPTKQQAVAAHSLQEIGAEEHAPAVDPDHRDGGAGRERVQRHPQIRVDVVHQGLHHASRTHNDTELLQQDQVRPDVNVGVQILQVKPEDNRDQNQSDIERAIPVEQIRDGIDLRIQPGRPTKAAAISNTSEINKKTTLSGMKIRNRRTIGRGTRSTQL